jgi:hypothetical protein
MFKPIRTACRVAGLLLAPALASAAVNPVSYGATPNDGTDDTAAFNLAIAAIPTTGGQLSVPAGTFLLSSALVFGAKPIMVLGEGQRVTVLKWTGSTHGLWFDNGSTAVVNLAFSVQSLSLLTSVGSTGAAILAEFPSVTGGSHVDKGVVSVNISDVHIGPEQQGSDYWRYGIVLRNVTSAKVRGFNIIGHGTTEYHAESGIHIDGRSLGVRITEGDIYGFYYGIRSLDNAEGIEGISISNVDTTDVNFGIHIVSPAHRPGTWISNCHTASRIRGIYLESQTQAFVENTLNYKIDGQSGWIGIHLLNTRDSKIVNNMSGRVAGGYVGSANGIALHYTTINNIISGNSSNDLDTHIWVVDTTSYGNFITGNRRVGSGTAIVDPNPPGTNPTSNNLL